MLKDFDEFFRFCFEHGGTLRNHKQFGEMARDLRSKIEAVEQSVDDECKKPACQYCNDTKIETANGVKVRCRFCGKDGL